MRFLRKSLGPTIAQSAGYRKSRRPFIRTPDAVRVPGKRRYRATETQNSTVSKIAHKRPATDKRFAEGRSSSGRQAGWQGVGKLAAANGIR